jgi:hypothetical protein
MRKVLKRIGLGLLIAGLALVLVATNVQAKYPGGTVVPKAVVIAQPEVSPAASITKPLLPVYTLEELQNAQEIPPLQVAVGQGQAAVGEGEAAVRPAPGPLQVTTGWDPQSGLPQPVPGELQTTIDLGPVSLATWAAAPTDPLSGPYPPFQRWTWYGSYATQATQTIGKLFFDTDANGSRDSSCTGEVIGTRTVATAGHCVSNGFGTYYTNFLFCPAWYKGAGSGAPQPGFGCWVAGSPHAEADDGSFGWHQDHNEDRDFACLLTNPVGDTYAGKIGNKTGWVAVANGGTQDYSIVSWGYPGNPPFPGYHIIADASTQWYNADLLPGGPVTTFVGSDMDSGVGGPWWLGMGHRTAEYPRVDPGGPSDQGDGSGTSQSFFVPWLYGLNASRRCAGTGCGTYPPTATDGPFWKEMGSPEFLSDGPSGDMQQVRDVFGLCWAAE